VDRAEIGAKPAPPTRVARPAPHGNHVRVVHAQL
jgi:hypothetical protein